MTPDPIIVAPEAHMAAHWARDPVNAARFTRRPRIFVSAIGLRGWHNQHFIVIQGAPRRDSDGVYLSDAMWSELSVLTELCGATIEKVWMP